MRFNTLVRKDRLQRSIVEREDRLQQSIVERENNGLPLSHLSESRKLTHHKIRKRRRLQRFSTLETDKIIRMPNTNIDINTTTTPCMPWPEKLSTIFVITIRMARWKECQKRLQHLSPLLTKWQGTNGGQINKTKWKKEKRYTNLRLSRGQMGCYDSHRRIWAHVVEKKIPYVLILEDDANLQPHKIGKEIQTALEELEHYDPEWELFYLSRSRLKYPIERIVTPHVAVPRAISWGCFAYVLSLRGAEILLKSSSPMRHSLDNYVSRMSQSMRAYTIYPNLFFVTDVVSDTNRIK